MIAALSVAAQFILMGELIWKYSILFGVLTLFAAYAGIKAVNIYVKRSGR